MKITREKLLEAITLPIKYGCSQLRNKNEYKVARSRNENLTIIFNDFLCWISTIYCAIGMALLLSLIGTAIFPGVGTAIGLYAGGVLGGYLGATHVYNALRQYKWPQILIAVGLIDGGVFGAIKGAILGAAVGSVLIPIPGVGTAVGGTLGCIGGCVLVGGLVSSAIAFATKILNQFSKAVLNVDATNVTNPDKYQVIPPNDLKEKDLYESLCVTKMRAEPVTGSLPPIHRRLFRSGFSLYDHRHYSVGELKLQNEVLNEIYQWKKENLGTWAVTKFFWTANERTVNAKLNNLIKASHYITDVPDDMVDDARKISTAIRMVGKTLWQQHVRQKLSSLEAELHGNTPMLKR